MENLVFLIYVLLIIEFWPLKRSKEASYHAGRPNYLWSGFANILFGCAGLFLFSYGMLPFKEGSLPDWADWTAMVGFVLMIISGLILVFKGFIHRD